MVLMLLLLVFMLLIYLLNQATKQPNNKKASHGARPDRFSGRRPGLSRSPPGSVLGSSPRPLTEPTRHSRPAYAGPLTEPSGPVLGSSPRPLTEPTRVGLRDTPPKQTNKKCSLLLLCRFVLFLMQKPMSTCFKIYKYLRRWVTNSLAHRQTKNIREPSWLPWTGTGGWGIFQVLGFLGLMVLFAFRSSNAGFVCVQVTR